MLIKEFRIVIPMSVQEYQIGQLYTIQKKSRLESVGAGSGVEIIENKPYESDNEKGQYTLKVYHVDERLPAGLKTISRLLFPKSALLFEEESWNCYPYTRTKYRHKLFKGFIIDIESKYLPDYGQSENVFNIKPSELSMRSVDYIDIVNDPISPNEYKPEEDPSKFYSSVNSVNQPLASNWLNELKANATPEHSVLNNRKIKYMCAYKLCRIECAFWGCQSRAERLISDSVLRHMILMSHRQAWCWQDEYYDLNMDDIRKLEEETQRYLGMKMKHQLNEIDDALTNSQILTDIRNSKNKLKLSIEKLKINKQNDSIEFKSLLDTVSTLDEYSNKIYETNEENASQTSDNSIRNEFEDIYDEEIEANFNLLKKRDHDTLSQNDEFYDAISQTSLVGVSTKPNKDSESSQTTNLYEYCINSSLVTNKNRHHFLREPVIGLSSSNQRRFISDNSNAISSSSSSSSSNNLSEKVDKIFPTLKQIKSNQIDTLILVVHGGNVTCTDTSKKSDFSNFKSNMETIMKTNYSNLYGRIAMRLVACEPICKDALFKLAALSPVFNEQTASMYTEPAEETASIVALHENLPFSTLPLLALADPHQHRTRLANFVRECNRVYHDFLASNEGHSFQGQVVVIGDSLGSILVYDSLCKLESNDVQTNSDDMTCDSSPKIVCDHSPTNKSAKSISSGLSVSKSPSPSTKRHQQQQQKENVKNSESNPNSNSSSNTQTLNVDNKDASIKRNSSNLSSSSGIEFTVSTSSAHLAPPHHANLQHQQSQEIKLDFDVSHFFIFGSPLGLVLTYRKTANQNIGVPVCSQIYNLFHLTDPVATRIEPLLCKQFKFIEPCMVARHSKYPFGDGSNFTLDHYIIKYGNLFETNNLIANKENVCDYSFVNSNYDQLKSLQKIIQTKKQWWGDNRVDYVLYAPDSIANFPRKSLPYIFHSCFWESFDAISFVLRMINSKGESTPTYSLDVTNVKNEKVPIEKWQRRLNRVKLKNLSANHRANDVIVSEDKDQILMAKFGYGPLDFGLSGEKVDIYIMTKNGRLNEESDWRFYATELTDNHGKIRYQLPQEKKLALGMYQVKMVVKCDQSSVEFHMAVLPTNTEAVVFSIDGSFAANISFSGTDPKVRAGAVDVVRHWQDLGYLIIYITARPDIQHYKVTNWLAQHNFPLGLVYFSDGLSRDPIRQKTEILRNMIHNNNIKIEAAYGSAKDIQMYSHLNLPFNKIFIIAKLKAKYANQAIILHDGYASHLSMLQNPNHGGSRQASGNARLIIKKGTFNIRRNPLFNNTLSTNIANSQSNGNNNSNSSNFNSLTWNNERSFASVDSETFNNGKSCSNTLGHSISQQN